MSTLKLNPQHHGDHRVLVGTLEQTDGSIVVPLMTVDGFREMVAVDGWRAVGEARHEFRTRSGADREFRPRGGADR